MKVAILKLNDSTGKTTSSQQLYVQVTPLEASRLIDVLRKQLTTDKPESHSEKIVIDDFRVTPNRPETLRGLFTLVIVEN